jgi:hypothetical protein
LLWPLVVLASLMAFISLVPQPPHDLWWHLRVGELVRTTGEIPTTNRFAWTLPADQPFVYGSWLGAYLLRLLHLVGDVELLLFMRTLLITLTLGLVGYEARRRSGSWRLAALALFFAGGMTLNNVIVRPQIWTWMPFVIFFILLGRYADGELGGRWLWVFPPLMALWVNLHGAYVLGLVLIGAYVVGEGLRAFLRRPDALGWQGIRHLTVIGTATFVATLANPQFVGIYRYVLSILTASPIQGLVVEWQPPTPTGLPNTLFFASIVALLLAWAYSRHIPTYTEALLLAGFTWLAWGGQRSVVWFGMVAMPLLAEALAGLLPDRYVRAPAPRSPLNLALAFLVLLALVPVQPWFVERLPLPEGYRGLVWWKAGPGPLLAVNTPIGAVEYLREHPGGHLFNDMPQGSYLIWALPEQGVFVDGRVELYPYEQWQDYVSILRGVRYDELLAKYGVDRILLNRRGRGELMGLLEDDPLWEKEYEDAHSQLWRKGVP